MQTLPTAGRSGLAMLRGVRERIHELAPWQARSAIGCESSTGRTTRSAHAAGLGVPMRAGDAFNAYRQFKQFVIIPLSIVESLELSAGAKLTYGRLSCHKSKDSTEAFVKRVTLANELKVSVDTVDRYLKELTTLNLIKPIRRGPHPAGYQFLYHEMLFASLKESAFLPTQEAVESADLPTQGNPKSGHFCGKESADLRHKVGKSAQRYKEEKVFQKDIEKESSSSAFSENAREGEEESSITLSLINGTAHPWTPENLIEASNALDKSKGRFSTLPPIDFQIVKAITENMNDLGDLRLWLGSSNSILSSAKSWGRYITDSQQWPARRKDATSIKASAPPPRPRAAEETSQPTAQQPTCDRCGRAGVHQDDTDPELIAWCHCHHAERRRRKQPDLVDLRNAQRRAS